MFSFRCHGVIIHTNAFDSFNILMYDDIPVGKEKLRGTHMSLAFCYTNIIEGSLLWSHSTLSNVSCLKIPVYILHRAELISTDWINIVLQRSQELEVNRRCSIQSKQSHAMKNKIYVRHFIAHKSLNFVI